MEDMNKLESKSIYQANRLIEASYKLKPSQQKFLRVMASLINSYDEDFKMYEFRISELLELFEVKDQSKYKEIPKQTRELMGNVLTFKNEKKIIQVPFLNYCEYEMGSGILRVQFHPFLKPFYLYLGKENPFTKYELKNILPLRSVYSIRLYELLKQYEKVGNRTITIEKLKEFFQIKPNEYARHYDFKRKVLEQAKKELPLKTDISFEYKENRTGRKVTSITFYITSKNVPKSPKPIEEISATFEEVIPESIPEDLQENILEKIKEDEEAMLREVKLINDVQSIVVEGISEASAKKILAAANNDIELIRRQYQNARMSRTPIPNIVGWLIEAVRNNYPDNIPANNKIEIKNNFTDRKQANYDIQRIERGLLGWDKHENAETEEETYRDIDEILGRKRNEEKEEDEDSSKMTGMQKAFKSLKAKK